MGRPCDISTYYSFSIDIFRVFKTKQNKTQFYHLYSSAAIVQFVKAVRQLGFLPLNVWIIICSAVKLLKAMNRVLKVSYDLQENCLLVTSPNTRHKAII